MAYELSHLRALEAESIHIFREVAAEFERPVLLFSGGKDSIVMLRLAEKAFWPARLPFPVMHIDTGHNFPEVLEFRDRRVAELGARLIVASVQESIDTGRVVEETGPRASRNRLQTTTLLDAIEEQRLRRRVRRRPPRRGEGQGQGAGLLLPRRVRPVGPQEPASRAVVLYNGRIRRGEHIRVFPLSNWTELDIWQYIADEGIEIPGIYFAHRREVFRRDGMLLAVTPFITMLDGEEAFETHGAVPHGRRRHVHRCRRVDGGDPRAGDRRGGGHSHHRARRHPGRRPHQRSGHGRPQEGRLFLMRRPHD